MKVVLWGARALVAIPLAFLLAWLGTTSSLFALSPVAVDLAQARLVILAVMAAVLVGVTFVRSSPTAIHLALAIPTFAAASYGANALDWLRLLKDFGIQSSERFDTSRYLLMVATLAIIWLGHVSDEAIRGWLRDEERGVPRADRVGLARARARDGGVTLVLALGATAATATAILVGRQVGEWGGMSGATVLIPVVAAVTLVGVGVWLARPPRARPHSGGDGGVPAEDDEAHEAQSATARA